MSRVYDNIIQNIVQSIHEQLTDYECTSEDQVYDLLHDEVDSTINTSLSRDINQIINEYGICEAFDLWMSEYDQPPHSPGAIAYCIIYNSFRNAHDLEKYVVSEDDQVEQE